MEAAGFPVTPVTIYQAPWPQISEGLNLHQQSCEYSSLTNADFPAYGNT